MTMLDQVVYMLVIITGFSVILIMSWCLVATFEAAKAIYQKRSAIAAIREFMDNC